MCDRITLITLHRAHQLIKRILVDIRRVTTTRIRAIPAIPSCNALWE